MQYISDPPGSNNHHRGYSEQNGYYGRGNSRPDSYIDAYQNGNAGPSNQENQYPYPNRRPRQNPRVQTEQGVYGNNVAYGSPTSPLQQNYQQSYDNVTALSGSGSGSNHTDPYGNSTDPSSLNSSVDQLAQQRLEERAQAEYGFQGFGGGFDPNGYPTSPVAVDQGYARKPVPQVQAAAPVQPAKSTLRKDLRKEANASEAAPDKRKSWFKRRFSKD